MPSTFAPIASPAAARDALEAALAGLDLSWSVLGGLAFGAPPDEIAVDFVVLHPQRGIALIDAAPGGGSDAAARFRALLAAERFDRRYPGWLPIIHLRLDAHGAAEIEDRLESTFARAPTLTVRDGRWVPALAELLTSDPAPAPAGRAGAALAPEPAAAAFARAADQARRPQPRPALRPQHGRTGALAATLALLIGAGVGAAAVHWSGNADLLGHFASSPASNEVSLAGASRRTAAGGRRGADPAARAAAARQTRARAAEDRRPCTGAAEARARAAQGDGRRGRPAADPDAEARLHAARAGAARRGRGGAGAGTEGAAAGADRRATARPGAAGADRIDAAAAARDRAADAGDRHPRRRPDPAPAGQLDPAGRTADRRRRPAAARRQRVAHLRRALAAGEPFLGGAARRGRLLRRHARGGGGRERAQRGRVPALRRRHDDHRLGASGLGPRLPAAGRALEARHRAADAVIATRAGVG
jgi:hypothetical protein